ncbi:MAG TPA: HepT-like ribonuclease domain-containing protein [Gemmatimonadota bacterium]|nr:HepT-like ribonuclease domain-containing protein [Gemmatimonadota bacterium]
MILRPAAIQERLKELDTILRELESQRDIRNILVHRYLGIDPREVYERFQTDLVVFADFGAEILAWLETVAVDPSDE